MNQLDRALNNHLVSNRTLVYPSETIRMIRMVSQMALEEKDLLRLPSLSPDPNTNPKREQYADENTAWSRLNRSSTVLIPSESGCSFVRRYINPLNGSWKYFSSINLEVGFGGDYEVKVTDNSSMMSDLLQNERLGGGCRCTHTGESL
jgi:hypothetical protein